MRVWSQVEGRWVAGEHAGGLRWFDLCRADEAALRDLAARFGLHPLSVDDCLSPYLHTPKVEDFGTYLFIILADMVDGPAGPELEEMDIFLGRDFLITYHDRPDGPSAVDALAHALEQGVSVRPGVAGLFYEVADRTVDAMIPRVTVMAEQLDEVEEDLISKGGLGKSQRRVVSQRMLAGRLRRLLTPELQVMMRFGRGEFAIIEEANRPYFRDVYDHLLRVDLALEGLREDTEVALSMHLSALNNRLSEVMKVLAIVSALALPGTVITGVFGTNFDNVPGLHSTWGFTLMCAGIVAVAGGMAYYFRRRGWF